ncbi:hypothetical protein GIB67_023056 [Kingdonia uniflora]|uniref:peptidyl-tRNA hydrolase n=1 Tax=Kingdonia uniflora TaxID=39325 RepID=A0A7J7MEC4_9MAGN|nr:hypothetical protein GIB67_023056 [Kingdonia uniflora]
MGYWWEMCGQVKVVLKSESEKDLLILQERAKTLHLPTHITIDVGRTQIAPNSRTVMALLGESFPFVYLKSHDFIHWTGMSAGLTSVSIFPTDLINCLRPADMVDDVTGTLKLL